MEQADRPFKTLCRALARIAQLGQCQNTHELFSEQELCFVDSLLDMYSGHAIQRTWVELEAMADELLGRDDE